MHISIPLTNPKASIRKILMFTIQLISNHFRMPRASLAITLTPPVLFPVHAKSGSWFMPFRFIIYH